MTHLVPDPNNRKAGAAHETGGKRSDQEIGDGERDPGSQQSAAKNEFDR